MSLFLAMKSQSTLPRRLQTNLQVSTPPPPAPPSSKPASPLVISPHLDHMLRILSFFILVCVFSIKLCCDFGCCDDDDEEYPHRRRRRLDDPPWSNRNTGVDPSTIRTLPERPYRGGDANYQTNCPICLGEFVDNENVKVITYCNHIFHPQCIGKWLQLHRSCPICRSTRLFGVNRSTAGTGLGMAERSGVINDQSTMRDSDRGEDLRSRAMTRV